jgi:hypothetical protein
VWFVEDRHAARAYLLFGDPETIVEPAGGALQLLNGANGMAHSRLAGIVGSLNVQQVKPA